MCKRKLIDWIQASRLASQGYIFFPLLLGQALWFHGSGHLDWTMAGLTWLFGLEIGSVWLTLACVGGVMMVLPLWLNSGYSPTRGRWGLAGWLALLDVLAIVAAIRLVQGAAAARGA